MIKLKQQSGQSVLEVLIAVAVFGLIAAALLDMVLGGDQSLLRGGQQTKAETFAQEGMEAVKSIKNTAWNELIYDQSGVSTTSDAWVFNGEGSDDHLNDYTRTIIFDDICRDNANQITVCPGSYTDIQSRQVKVNVSWPIRLNINNSVQKVSYLTNWDSMDWAQTDWSGGSGQPIWSNISEFDSSDGNINFETDGQIILKQISSEATSTWPFDISSDYSYDPAKIEVIGSHAQLVPSGGGEINGFVNDIADSYEFDALDNTRSSIVSVGSGIYAIAYSGNGADGWLRTVSIDASGNIGNAVIDSLEWDTSQGLNPKIIHVSGNIYAIAYEGAGNDGFLRTVSIDASGNIGNAVIDSLEWDASNGREPAIINVSGATFAIAYRGVSDDGWLITVSIDASGNIGNAVIDSYEWDTSNGLQPDILHISDNIFVITYQGVSADGFMRTVAVAPNGVITKSIIDTLEFDTADGLWPHPVYVGGNMYAVAYQGTGSDGWIKTMSINAGGIIGNSVIRSFEFDASQGLQPYAVSIGNNKFIIAYSDINSYGRAVLLSIDNAGIIGAVEDSLTFNPTRGVSPYLADIGNNFFAVSYSGPDSDGWLTTVQLSANSGSYPVDNPTITPFSSFLPASANAWISFEEQAIKNNGEIHYQISINNGLTWLFWNGSAWVQAGLTNFNTAEVANMNISRLSTSTQSINFRAFLGSNGTEQIILDEIKIGYSGNSMGYKTIGWLVSSAFNLSDDSPVQVISWDEYVPVCTPDCSIRLQVRTAADDGGVPGYWSSWYGAGGADTYFTYHYGELVPRDLNWKRWVQYRVELVGDGNNSPSLNEVRVNYK